LAQITKPITLHNRLSAFLGVSLQIIGVLFLTRLLIDTGLQIGYPFIPQISVGLGLTIVGFSWLIFIRSLAGLTGPIFGILADRYGRRNIMAASLLGQSIAAIGLTLSWQWWATAPMILFGLCLTAFLPAEQAYISDQVAYERRGRALAFVEISFSTSGIVSLPIIGWLIDAFGWRSPFFILSLFSLLGAVLIWFQLPAVEHRSNTSLTLSDVWKVSIKPNVLAAVTMALFVFFAAGTLLTIWGIWLSADFSLKASEIGLVGIGIGFANLCGVILTGLFIDRIGKRRGSLLGLFITMIAFLILPFAQATLTTAIAVLMLIGISIEFTIVSLIPLWSEQAPEARATVFSLVGFGASIGIAAASPITATLFEQVGLWAVGAVAAVCLLIAVALTARFLYEGETPPTEIAANHTEDLAAR